MRVKVICTGNFKDGGARYVAQRLALKNSIKGFAKKENESTMSLELQGDETSVNQLLETFSKGNAFYSVETIEKELIDEVSTEKFFSIK
ncbi:acylphosphatase [Vagococcus sp. PNs007]|uniref:Acylphosphatase n=1 Tax=Vagococcus proximus TaxID=2991417 RepID=A0ABT5WYU8_9ENTE|nr:acylphosphatase [Vagococcus proximus]